ncbi:MAG: hypothetical protein KDK24_06860 [Pseudooceanicola sp.]|nr:hypothetical protein [Pseudooceanicola sp.]
MSCLSQRLVPAEAVTLRQPLYEFTLAARHTTARKPATPLRRIDADLFDLIFDAELAAAH